VRIFTYGENPATKKAASSPTAPKYSRRLSPSQVCGSAVSLFLSGASRKTVINCFIPRLSVTYIKKVLKTIDFTGFSALFIFLFFSKSQKFVLTTISTTTKFVLNSNFLCFKLKFLMF